MLAGAGASPRQQPARRRDGDGHAVRRGPDGAGELNFALIKNEILRTASVSYAAAMLDGDALGWLLAIGFAAVFFIVAVIAGHYLSRP